MSKSSRSSRTSTAQWKKTRARELRRAQRAGVTKCRYCGCIMDYFRSLQPNSAEVDHINGHANVGDDGMYQVICRRCNQSKGAKSAPGAKVRFQNQPLTVSRRW